MAILPLRKCPTPGCNNLSREGKCTECVVVSERERGNSNSRGYNWSWRRARLMFLRRNPLCVDPFGIHAKENHIEPATLVDHIIPHKGDREKFWNKDNLQSLCASCHCRKTFSENKICYQKMS